MINKVHVVLPVPERWLSQDNPNYDPLYGDPVNGGRYVRLTDYTDVTGLTVARAIITCAQFKPKLYVSEATIEPNTKSSGTLIKCNLIKAKVGWSWVTAPENSHTTFVISTLCTVEQGGKHYYALELCFDDGVTLARYANSKTEPRLRPTTSGVLHFERKVGVINLRSKEHPVFERIVVKNRG